MTDINISVLMHPVIVGLELQLGHIIRKQEENLEQINHMEKSQTVLLDEIKSLEKQLEIFEVFQLETEERRRLPMVVLTIPELCRMISDHCDPKSVLRLGLTARFIRDAIKTKWSIVLKFYRKFMNMSTCDSIVCSGMQEIWTGLCDERLWIIDYFYSDKYPCWRAKLLPYYHSFDFKRKNCNQLIEWILDKSDKYSVKFNCKKKPNFDANIHELLILYCGAKYFDPVIAQKLMSKTHINDDLSVGFMTKKHYKGVSWAIFVRIYESACRNRRLDVAQWSLLYLLTKQKHNIPYPIRHYLFCISTYLTNKDFSDVILPYCLASDGKISFDFSDILYRVSKRFITGHFNHSNHIYNLIDKTKIPQDYLDYLNSIEKI